MTREEITVEGGIGATPIACTLTSPGLAARSGRWEQLAARAITERAETPNGLRLWFRPEPGVEEELRALADAENECCAWATWTVRTDASHLVLDLQSAGHGIAALHGMFTSVPPAPAACSD